MWTDAAPSSLFCFISATDNNLNALFPAVHPLCSGDHPDCPLRAPRRPAERQPHHGPRRLIEQSHLLQKALSASILLHLHPKSKISVAVTVLADDGRCLEVAINAATLALIDAGIPLKDMVCVCAAGQWDTTGDDGILVDLNRREIQNVTGAG